MPTALKISFSNPRSKAEFDNWPIGGANRGKCRFSIEHDAKRGFRFVRQTTDKHGVWCKPKAATFGGMACIVDGSDGRTYLLQVAAPYGFVSIKRHDFMNATSEAGLSAVFCHEHAEDHAALCALIVKGQDAATMLYPTLPDQLIKGD